MAPASQSDAPRRPHHDRSTAEGDAHPDHGDGTATTPSPKDEALSLWSASSDLAAPISHESACANEHRKGEGVVAHDAEDPYAAVAEAGNLGDLNVLATDLFNVWLDSSEIRWAAYMWSILEKAGLTAYEEWDEVGRTLVVCRLVALAGMNREFAARAWHEGYPGGWRDSVLLADVLGEYPLLDEVAVGRLAERTGVVADSDLYAGSRETVASLLCEIADHEWPTVVKTLTNSHGDSWLLASLWMTRDGDACYPLPEVIVRSTVNASLPEMMDAFAWVSDGCDWRA